MDTSTGDAPADQTRYYRMDAARFVGVRRRILIGLAILGPLIFGGIWYLDEHFKAKRDLFDFAFMLIIFVYLVYGKSRESGRNGTLWFWSFAAIA